MKRVHQSVLIGSFLPLCWLGMMAVHELGHVVGAWLTGGRVAKVVLHPLTISPRISPTIRIRWWSSGRGRSSAYLSRWWRFAWRIPPTCR